MIFKSHLSPSRGLQQLARKQTVKGAIIVGLVVGFMFLIQGAGYNAVYPDQKAKAGLAATLKTTPALGVMYGESKNLPSTKGYMVFRVVPIMSLVAAIWGLTTATRLLRGQEEDGRWELITANNVSRRAAAWRVMLGFGASLITAYLIATVVLILYGRSPDVSMTVGESLLTSGAIFLPAMTFACLGFFTSQLSVTRRRALLYGLVPLLVFFALRSIGNTVDDLHWLKYLTPFGWSELLSPIIGTNLTWLFPPLAASFAFAAMSIYFVGKRDLGDSLIQESTTVKPRYALLGSAGKLAVRHNFILFISWGIGALAMGGIIASIASLAADSFSGSPAAAKIVHQLGSANDLKIAIIGSGLIFLLTVLLLMTANSVGSIRSTEAKNYLDNILVQPVRRSSWLGVRLSIAAVAAVTVVIACTLLSWIIAKSESIPLDLDKFLMVNIALLGPVIFTLGFGALLYGLWPRLAATGMYIVVGWSFLIDMLASAIKLNDIVAKSSLFHYVSTSSTKSPDWSAFTWLVILGILMVIIGIIAFTKRDIIAE
jgi:ABC-2 type transport system permease protein